MIALPVAGSCRDADAPAPRPVAAFRERMRTARTAWVGIDVVREPSPHGPLHDRRPETWLLRVDAERELATMTGDGRWVYRDRRLTWAHTGFDEPPLELGPWHEDSLAELWAEARAGFPTSRLTWTPESSVTGPGRPPGDALRVDLPFAWARDWEIYVGIQEDGKPTWLAIFDTAGSWWKVPRTALDVRFDVPLLDDTDHRFRSPDIEESSALRPWHELGAVRSPFRSDHTGTAQPPPFNPRGFVASDFTAAAWDAPCVPGTTTTRDVRLSWTWDPARAKSADRALIAMAGGCRMAVEATLETRFTLTDGASARFEGALTLRDDMNGVVWSAPVDQAWTAPPGGGKRWTRVPVHGDLRKGVHPQWLALALDGTLTWTCTKAGPAGNQVGIARVEREPELHWPGCFPEYGFVTGP